MGGDDSTVINTLTMTITREELGGKLRCVVSSAALSESIFHDIDLDVNGKCILYT